MSNPTDPLGDPLGPALHRDRGIEFTKRVEPTLIPAVVHQQGAVIREDGEAIP